MHLRIKPIKNLTAIEMMMPGDPTGISGWSYVAGSVNINVRINYAIHKNPNFVISLFRVNKIFPS